MRLNRVSGAVIIAASGMCEAGRIRHHLFYNLARRDSTILFVGFQAAGSLGRVILEGAKRVRISGRDVAVRAAVRSIDSYSAHADQSELIQWIKDRGPIAGTLFLDHGEEASVMALRDLADAEHLAPDVIVPEIGERYELRPGAPAKRLRSGREDLHGVIGRDWQNDYASFATSLKQQLLRLPDDAARRKAVVALQRVLEQVADPNR